MSLRHWAHEAIEFDAAPIDIFPVHGLVFDTHFGNGSVQACL